MFPTLRHRIGATLLDRIDVALELSTLGAYGLGEDHRPLALDDPGAPVPGSAPESADVPTPASGPLTAMTPRRRGYCDRQNRSHAPRARA